MTNTKETKHSPTPWEVRAGNLIVSEHTLVASCYDGINAVNSHHIVHCVNAYPELVEALQKAVQRLEIIQDTIKEKVIDRLHKKKEISLEGITTSYARIADTLFVVIPILDSIKTEDK
jgi:translation initiation factor 2B subunit (eIF-2B alpha/beta/delta family)